MDGKDCSLYMSFRKTLDSVQGMAIYGDEAYVLYHTGVCSVYNLASKDCEAAASFRLGSFNEGHPSEEYCNHANQAMFSGLHHQNNPIPLLYVTTGNSGGADEDGYFYRCAVENITKTTDALGRTVFSSQTLQTIIYKDQGPSPTGWEKPCWGAPAFYVDHENSALYIFSARYRTTKAYLQYYDQNAFIVTRFPLPKIEDGNQVTLTALDIVDQFTVPFDILFTQGGTLYQGKIYHTFGFGNDDYPLGIRVYDLAGKAVAARMDLSRSIFADEEIECCAFYRGKLLCNTNHGKIYCVGKGIFPL